MLRILQSQGKLKRQREPDSQLIVELFRLQMHALPCDECGSVGLRLAPLDDAVGDWQEARTCQRCGQQIPAERLEIFPDATQCAACQEMPDAQEVDYCPHCGMPMELQSSNRGISRYRQQCSSCGRRR